MFENTSVIIVEYLILNVDYAGEGKHLSRFVAETEKEILDCCKQLYQSFCEKYPESEFPKRKFEIVSVSRQIATDYEAFTVRIKGD